MRSACAAPTTFGVISENTRIANEIAIVPSASASSPSPNSRVGDHRASASRRPRRPACCRAGSRRAACRSAPSSDDRELRAALAALRAMLQPIAVDRHHRRLGDREEAGTRAAARPARSRASEGMSSMRSVRGEISDSSARRCHVEVRRSLHWQLGARHRSQQHFGARTCCRDRPSTSSTVPPRIQRSAVRPRQP